jgi:hypothetical protein
LGRSTPQFGGNFFGLRLHSIGMKSKLGSEAIAKRIQKAMSALGQGRRRMAQPVYPQLPKCPCVRAVTLRANSGNAGPPISRVILHPHRMHSTEARSQRSSAVGGGDSLRPRIQRTMATTTRATVPNAPTAVRLLPGPWLGPSIASRKNILPVAVSTRLKQPQKRRYSAKKPLRLFSIPPIVRSPALMDHLRTPLRSTGSSALACSHYRLTGSARARMGL